MTGTERGTACPRRASTTPLIALLAALLAASCDGAGAGAPGNPAPSASSPDTGAAPESHRRMLALLADIAARTSEEHFFLGDGLARRIRARLESLPPETDPRTRWKLHHQAGVVEQRLGNVRASVENFSRALELMDAAALGEEWRQRTTFDLAMAYLRLGEVENCCARRAPESCILPLRGAAIHTERLGSSKAAELFERFLDRTPKIRSRRLMGIWLLNVAHMTLGTHPDGVPERWRIPGEAFRASSDSAGFPVLSNVAATLGVDSMSLSGGAIVDDLDGDGTLDILTSSWDTSAAPRLFFNAGDGTFRERSSEAGLDGLFGGLNVRHADYDNDGDLDLLVLRGAWLGERGRHPNSLLRNDGRGHFTDVTLDAGLGEVYWPTQTAEWADYDNDGDLDLYVGNEHSKRLAAPSQLFRNEGNGTFVDIAASAGVTNDRYAKGVAWGDFDGDRFPDLYVSNLDGANRLYRNRGDGTFVDVAPELGVTEPIVSFPVWFWDFDNDGVLDLFVSSYAGRVEEYAAYVSGQPVEHGLPRLYRGNGKGGFQDVTAAVGLDAPVLPMGSNFGDLDGDGWLDFYLGTGSPEFTSLMPNLLYRNLGGKRFENVTFAAGMGHLQKGHAVSFADVDHDGDLDVFEQMGGAFRGDAYADALYENPAAGNRWIVLELRGTRSNRRGVGARICVDVLGEDGASRSIHRTVGTGGSFGSNPLRQHIGLGGASRIERIEIYWPASETRAIHETVALDRAWTATEGAAELTPLELRRFRLGGER